MAGKESKEFIWQNKDYDKEYSSYSSIVLLILLCKSRVRACEGPRSGPSSILTFFLNSSRNSDILEKKLYIKKMIQSKVTRLSFYAIVLSIALIKPPNVRRRTARDAELRILRFYSLYCIK